MATDVKNVKVKIDYKKDIITIVGEGVEASLEINGAELRKMYWGKSGAGLLSAKIN